jgi:Ni,Fe-hydrogenase III small subunit
MRFPEKISFTKEYKISTNERSRLIVREGENHPILIDPDQVRNEIRRIFGSSLKLRQVSAGGDNSCEIELNATNNVNFDVSRYGIDFVASPRHADGLVITGPITANMAEPLERCYNAVPNPKIIIIAGTDAISGGIFADSPALNREFLSKHAVDLYVPGNPVHPLTFINGVLSLLRK